MNNTRPTRSGNALLTAVIVMGLAAVVVLTSTDSAVATQRALSKSTKEREVLAALDIVLGRRQQQVIFAATNYTPDWFATWKQNYGVDFIGDIQVRWKVETCQAARQDNAGAETVIENPAPGDAVGKPANAEDNPATFFIYRIAGESRYDSTVEPDAAGVDKKRTDRIDSNDMLVRAQGVRFVVTPNESALNYLLYYAQRGPKADIELSHGPQLSLIGDIYSGGSLYFGSGTASNDWSSLTPVNSDTKIGPDPADVVNPITTWAVSTAYTVGKLVVQGTGIYQCKAGHTSASSNQPGTGSSWRVFWHDVTTCRVIAVDGVYRLSKQTLFSAINSFPMQGTVPSGYGLNSSYSLSASVYPGERAGNPATASYRMPDPAFLSPADVFNATYQGTILNPMRALDVFATRDPSPATPRRWVFINQSAAAPTGPTAGVALRGVDGVVPPATNVANDSRSATWGTTSMQSGAPGFSKQVRTQDNGASPEEMAAVFIGRPEEPQKLETYDIDGDPTTEDHEYAMPQFISNAGLPTTEMDASLGNGRRQRLDLTPQIDAIEIPGTYLGKALGTGLYLGRKADYTGWQAVNLAGNPFIAADGTITGNEPTGLGLIIRERPKPDVSYFPTPNPPPSQTDPLYMPYAYGHVRSSIWPFVAGFVAGNSSALYSGSPYASAIGTGSGSNINTTSLPPAQIYLGGGKLNLVAACNPGPAIASGSGPDYGLASAGTTTAGWGDTASGYTRYSIYHQDNWRFISLRKPVATATNGLNAYYYNDCPDAGTRWMGPFGGQPVYRTVDAAVNFAWASAAPTGATGIRADYFSVRWQGFLNPRYSEAYTFTANTTDVGVRVWVDGVLLIDAWSTATGDRTPSQTISLTQDKLVPITVELFEQTGTAGIHLDWASATQVREIIPTTRLFTQSKPAFDPATFSAVQMSVDKLSVSGPTQQKVGLMLRPGAGVSPMQDGRDPYLALCWSPTRGVYVQMRGERARADQAAGTSYYVGSASVEKDDEPDGTFNSTSSSDSVSGEISIPPDRNNQTWSAADPAKYRVTRRAVLVPSLPTLGESYTPGSSDKSDLTVYTPGTSAPPTAPTGVTWPAGSGTTAAPVNAMTKVLNPFSSGLTPEGTYNFVYRGPITLRWQKWPRERTSRSFTTTWSYRLANLDTPATQLFRWQPGDAWPWASPVAGTNTYDNSRNLSFFSDALGARVVNGTYGTSLFSFSTGNIANAGTTRGAVLSVGSSTSGNTGYVYWFPDADANGVSDVAQPDSGAVTIGTDKDVYYLSSPDTRPTYTSGSTTYVQTDTARIKDLMAQQFGGTSASYNIITTSPTWPTLTPATTTYNTTSVPTQAMPAVPAQFPGWARVSTISGATFTLTGGSGQGSNPFTIGDILAVTSSAGFEYVQVATIPSTTTITVNRGVNGTVSLAHPANAMIGMLPIPVTKLDPAYAAPAGAAGSSQTWTVSTTTGLLVNDVLTLTSGTAIEMVRVTAIPSATTLTVTRGFKGICPAAGWPVGTTICTVGVEAGKTAAAITAAQTSFTLSVAPTVLASAVFGSPLAVGSLIQMDSEQMWITGISGTTVTVTRAANFTTAATHVSGSLLLMMTPRTFSINRSRTVTLDLNPWMSAGCAPTTAWRATDAAPATTPHIDRDLGWYWSGVGAWRPWKGFWAGLTPTRYTGGISPRVWTKSQSMPETAAPAADTPANPDNSPPSAGAGLEEIMSSGRWNDDQPAKWISGRSYQAGNCVFNNGALWVAKANHTAAATDQPGIGANTSTYWSSSSSSQVWLRVERMADPDGLGRFLVRLLYADGDTAPAKGSSAWKPVLATQNADTTSPYPGAKTMGSAPKTDTDLILDLTPWFREARTTTAASIANATATTITVTGTTGFFAGDLIRIDDEFMRIDSVLSSTQLTVTRGMNGTGTGGSAAAHTTVGTGVVQQRFRGPDLIAAVCLQSGSYTTASDATVSGLRVETTEASPNDIIDSSDWDSATASAGANDTTKYLASQYQAFWGPYDITEDFFAYGQGDDNTRLAKEDWIYNPREFWSQSRWWEDGSEKDPNYILPSNFGTLSNREVWAKSTILTVNMGNLQNYLKTRTFLQATDPLAIASAGSSVAPALSATAGARTLISTVSNGSLLMHVSRFNRYPWNPNLNGPNPWNPSLPNFNSAWKTNATLAAEPIATRQSDFALRLPSVRLNNMTSLLTSAWPSLQPYATVTNPAPASPAAGTMGRAPAIKPQDFHHAVRIINGSSIDWGFTGAGDTFGASKTLFVTPNQLFIQGDLNTIPHPVIDQGVTVNKATPLAIFCDTPTFLSNSWSDGNFTESGLTVNATAAYYAGAKYPSLARAQAGGAAANQIIPPASDTTYACALLTHNTPTTKQTVRLGEASSVINTMLFLEDWAALPQKNFTFIGSIVVMDTRRYSRAYLLEQPKYAGMTPFGWMTAVNGGSATAWVSQYSSLSPMPPASTAANCWGGTVFQVYGAPNRRLFYNPDFKVKEGTPPEMPFGIKTVGVGGWVKIIR